MISAFGVEHTISKSLVNGAFKPASQLTRAERKAVGGYKALKGRSAVHHRQAMLLKENQQGIKGLESQGVEGISVDDIGAMIHGNRAVTIRTGSKSHGKSQIFGYASDKKMKRKLLAHEMQHAKPKRSAYRFVQLHEEPEKLMREEARADYFSHFRHYSEPDNTTYYGRAAATGNTANIGDAYPNMPKKKIKASVQAYKDLQDDLLARGVKRGKKVKHSPVEESIRNEPPRGAGRSWNKGDTAAVATLTAAGGAGAYAGYRGLKGDKPKGQYVNYTRNGKQFKRKWPRSRS